MKKMNVQGNGLNVHLISLLAIWVAIASPWFDLSVSNHSFVKTYVAGIGIGILMLITLWKRHNEDQLTFHISWLKVSWLLLFVLGTVSIFWSVNVDFTITKWMIWFTVLCAFIVGYHLTLDEKTLIKLCWGLLIAAFAVAAIGILQYWFDPFTLTQAAPPSSTFGNKNMTTQPIVLIWPLALFLLFSRRITYKQTWLLTTLTALLMVFVFYTKTRSSWLSITGEIILIAGFLFIKRRSLRDFITWHPNKTKAVLFAVGLFLLLININESGWAWFSQGASATFDGAGNSGQARFRIWAVAIDMIQASPIFGTGLGTWFHNEIQGGFGIHNVMSYQRVHNDFLELGVDLGIVGMVLLLIGAAALTIAIMKTLNNDNKIHGLFYFLLWVALCGSFVQMQFSFPYQLAMPALLLGLYMGLIAKRSENFIKPIKLLQIKVPKLYHQSTKAFWLGLIIVISAIYMDWANTYSTLNDLNKKQKLHLVKTAIPSIYHLELPNILGFLGNAYTNANRPDVVIKVEEQILKYWPNSNASLYRYAHALMKKKRYTKALEVVKHLKQVAGRGYFVGHIVEIQIYQKTGQAKKFNHAFLELLNQDERLLSLGKNTYQFLLQLSLSQRNLLKYSEQIYKKYSQYRPYNCSIENNIAGYYVNQKQYKKAKTHVDIIKKSNDTTCLRPNLVRILKTQGF